MAALLLVGLTAAPAAAADDCDAIVVDEAGVLTDPGAVEAAAQDLAAIGAEVRIRLLRRSSGDLIGGYLQETVQSCPSWSDGGRVRSSLIAIIVSFEPRVMDITVGDDWGAYVDGAERNRLRAEVIGPKFRQEAYEEGLIDGLNTIQSNIQGTSGNVGGAESTSPGTTHELGFIWGTLLVLIVLVAVIVLISVIRRRRRELAQRQQRAIEASYAAAQRSHDLTAAHDDLKLDWQILEGNLAETDAQSLGNTYAQVGSEVEGALSALGDMQMLHEYKAEGRHHRDRYPAITDAYTQAGQRLAKATAAVKALKQQLEQLKQLIADVSERLERLPAMLDAADMQVAELQAAGYLTDHAAAVVQLARGRLASAEAARDQRDWHAANSESAHAERLCAQAIAWCQKLPDFASQLVAERTSLLHQADRSAAALDHAHDTFRDMAATYAESSWQAVRGNGSASEERLELVRHLLDLVAGYMDMRDQNWILAAAALHEAQALLAEVGDLLEAITSLAKRLAWARDHAQEEIDVVRHDIAKATAYRDQYDDDIRPEIDTDLKTAGATLQRAVDALAQPQPDYLEVVRLAQEANSSADRIYAECVAEREAMERLRHQAKTALTTAETAVATVENYVHSHNYRSDISNATVTQVSTARTKLTSAKEAGDLEQRISLAKAAAQLAKNALRDANSQVRAAEAARQPVSTGRIIILTTIGDSPIIGGSGGSGGGSSQGSWGGSVGGGSSQGGW